MGMAEGMVGSMSKGVNEGMSEPDQLAGQSLPFWVTTVTTETEETDDGDGADTKSLFGRAGNSTGSSTGTSPAPVLRSVPLGPLRKNLAETVDALQQVFADAAARDNVLQLAEAHLSFQVTATGGVQLIGTGQLTSGRGLTLVFKRP
ncbi:hypothetical protein OK074_9103 [Actinobacteria bacterium OK074]|nr:hypothetical protein OK074_9103 [Actinobacteria bacterium OK074]